MLPVNNSNSTAQRIIKCSGVQWGWEIKFNEKRNTQKIKHLRGSGKGEGKGKKEVIFFFPVTIHMNHPRPWSHNLIHICQSGPKELYL